MEATETIKHLEFILKYRLKDLSRDPLSCMSRVFTHETLLRENPGIYTPNDYGEIDMTYPDWADDPKSSQKEQELLKLFGDYKIPASDYFSAFKAVAENPNLIDTENRQSSDQEERYRSIGSLFGFSMGGFTADCDHHRKVIYRVDENKREDFREEFNKILERLDVEFYIFSDGKVIPYRDKNDRFIHDANLYLKYIGPESGRDAFVPWFADGYSKEEIENPLPRPGELIQGDGRDVHRIESLEKLCNQIADIPSCNKLTICPGTAYVVMVK
ncbi:hypothetical protein J4221_03430 [Candidatus Pacearchaeota archaeon]|nr:hypothetical protein [Candidatus Pacearchaeota archaeon]